LIYLASASPRRRELLRQLGIAFEVMPSNLLEVREPGESPEQYVLRVALDKARYVARLVRERGLEPRPVLGADTEVVLDGEILGKPRDRRHGLEMLRRLAGRSHEVLTGIAVLADEAEHTALSRSTVTFGPMSEAEIRRYWETGEGEDKAGGYAVQGRAAAFIARIEGSYSGIMGLPLYELWQLLKRTGLGVSGGAERGA
jgi:septum formation protein